MSCSAREETESGGEQEQQRWGGVGGVRELQELSSVWYPHLCGTRGGGRGCWVLPHQGL